MPVSVLRNSWSIFGFFAGQLFAATMKSRLFLSEFIQNRLRSKQSPICAVHGLCEDLRMH